jgi:hypothetical protein
LQHLRSRLGRTRASRLALPATTFLLSASLALSACGAAQEAGAAAIVDGKAISDQEVQTVTSEFNAISPEEKTTPRDALFSLIVAPYILAEAKRAGKSVPADAIRKSIEKGGTKPTDATITFVQTQLALRQDSPSRLDDASKASVAKEVRKAKITVNPRYGTFDVTGITPTSPNWLKPSATPPPN